jgi:hypothetical protein
MSVLIEDTARNNLATWAGEVVQSGTAAGAVLSPFSTPRNSTSYKQSARQTVRRLADDGAEVWFDPVTHALQMPTVGDFRYYDDWPLWGGPRGDLSSPAAMRGHVERVFEEQDTLDVPHLAPTILLHSAQSPESRQALDLAQIAIDLDSECRLSVAGDAAFWASGTTLDAHIGGLAQLEPAGWWLTVARNFTVLPVPALQEEIHGVCRTARSLGEDAEVHVSHGDLAGLPAIAAGATSLGTGWDPRQRVCGYASYEIRTAGDGGQWFQQATLEGLLSLMTRGEANLLAQRDASLAAQLLPGAVPPGPKEAFIHHIEVLDRVVSDLEALNARAAYDSLTDRYRDARQGWQDVATVIGIGSRAETWVRPFARGLRLYGQTEGF